MDLKTVLETLDGVDDAIAPFYAETDGKFILQIEGVDSHPDVANLKSAYERTKADRDTARTERDAAKALAKDFPDDFSLEKWNSLKDGKPDEAALIQLRETLEGERDAWKTKAEAADQRAVKNALDRDLTDALTENGVTNPTFAKAARTMLSPDVKINDDGVAIVDTDMGPLPLSEHVKRWAAAEGKDFVTPPSGGGGRGGKDTGAGSQKWSEMTSGEKTRLHQTDPEAYNRIKAAG